MSKAELKRYLSLLQYELALQEAKDSLIRFAEVTMPVDKFMDDPSKTKYMAAEHHRLMGELMEEAESTDNKRIIISVPPRHGKSELCTRRFAAWYSGRHPDRDIIVATYGEMFAREFGAEVRDIIKSRRFRQIFPDYKLDKVGSEHLTNTKGGNLYFLGRRSSVTGRGADLIIVDDPTKDDKEASSGDFREDLWQWFTQTLLTRTHTDRASVVLTQTRWHEDDLPGRLTDPSNPVYDEEIAQEWQVFNLRAIAEDDDPMGRKPGEPLWPERFGLPHLNKMRRMNATSFAALFQSDPTPDDGVFFQKEGIFEYDSHELPDRLTKYCASDHAVSTKNHNDRTCLIPYGVDQQGDAWILPDVVWDRIPSDIAVEQMVALIKRHGPTFWYAEKGQLARSIGPFLEARMKQEGIYVPLVLHPIHTDKRQFAQSGRALCAQGRIRFPRWAPWWQRAKAELLKFPNARFDDFVDVVSIIGMRMNQHHGPGANLVKKKPTKGTFAELKEQFRRHDAREAAKAARAGW